MASEQDYFTPGQMPAAQPDQNIMPSIGAFMQNPQALSALLAFGTQAMIPQWGGAGVQFAKGVGAAGEALDKQQEEARKQQETESKGQLREAQAGAAEARANTAGTRASLTGLIEQGKTERNLTLAKLRLAGMHQNYVHNLALENAAIRKANADPLKPPGSAPIPEKTALPMDEWVKNNPLLQNLGLVPQSGVPADTGDAGDSGGIPAAATPDTANFAAVPPDPKQRTPGQTYTTPKGPLKWTGTGWVNP